MADRRRNRKRPEAHADEFDKPEKVEYQIAKYLRSHLPPKQTTLLGHKVQYFIASRAVDLLMNSKWAKTDKRSDEVMFSSRESATNFLNTMLRHKFFHRAKAIIVKKEIKLKQDNDSTDEGNKNKEKSKIVKNEPQESNTILSTNQTTTKKKEKKKVKLDMHVEQIFVDLNEPYVWIYDYIPMSTWLMGGAFVLAAISICLFPLWPRTVRSYIYYFCIAIAVFLFFIIFLAILKLVVFALVWVVTFGRHHLWILPNLTEDVGFFQSFWPLYKHENKNRKPTDDKNDANNDQPIEDCQNCGMMIENEDKEEGTEEDEEGDEDEKNSELDEPLTTKNSNGFEILDENECNVDDN